VIAVSFRVLGPLEVEFAGRVVEVLWRGDVLESLPQGHGWSSTLARPAELRLETDRGAGGHGRKAPPSSAPPNSPFPVCQLPLDLPDVTGRERLVAELLGELHHAPRRPRRSRACCDRALALWRELAAGSGRPTLTTRLPRFAAAKRPGVAITA
jgi:hypothetical protein